MDIWDESNHFFKGKLVNNRIGLKAGMEEFRMKKKKWLRLVTGMVCLVIVAAVFIAIFEPEYAYLPPSNQIAEPLRRPTNPENGTIGIKSVDIADEETLMLGRKALYGETFGNEVFFSDIMGINDGALRIDKIMKAISELKGSGTTNLRVELAEDFTVLNKTYRKGEKIDTGLDVAPRAALPIGLPVKIGRNGVRIGVSCMLCHATLDPVTKKVVEGAPNSDLNAGFLMAMASNSAAYFTHTEVEKTARFFKEGMKQVVTTDGGKAVLPDPEELEKAVDETLAKWPKGSFDTTIDWRSNPTQTPDTFTKGAHPYSWSGFAAVGPFHGLSVFANNVHAQNTDALAQQWTSPYLFGIDPEVYVGTILQRAANPRYRFRPDSGRKPSEFFASWDPTPGVPGVNELIKPPSYPKLTYFAPDGLVASSPGKPAGEQIHAMSAYQNRLVPPAANRTEPGPKQIELGKEVFRRAGCIVCHAGEAYTNNKVIPVERIGTEPSRAAALKKTENWFADALFYPQGTPVPIPKGTKPIPVRSEDVDETQLMLGFAHGNSRGGYKVKGLVGLYWTAPYLHDGGVAVGPDIRKDLGVPGTLMKGVQPDPANSLRALLDRELRSRVVSANRGVPELRDVHVSGAGHSYWVDEKAGFSKEEQDALVEYLLSLKPGGKPEEEEP